jgi:hypothetical protein
MNGIGGKQMNCDTGELRKFSDSLTNEEREAFFKNFIPVPQEFSEEAERLLGEEERVFADMTTDTPLVNWAKSQRNQPHPDGNRLHRRKMAKESRRKNRR